MTNTWDKEPAHITPIPLFKRKDDEVSVQTEDTEGQEALG